MFGRRIPLFEVFGFSVRLDPSWFLLAILIAWSLGGENGYFRATHEGLGPAAYWLMGAAAALGLFTSIVLHELAHSVMARRFGLAIKGITLFIFGGVAEMTEEPESPRAEFLVAVAGPLASVLIAASCFGIGQVLRASGTSVAIYGVVAFLAWMNAALVLFNLVPAFPLDGGRMLRALLWRVRGDLTWATRITAGIGSFFGLVLMALGVFSLVQGDFVGGLWRFVLGLFLRQAAQSSKRFQLARRLLEGEAVRDFMAEPPTAVPRHLPLREFVETYLYRRGPELYPVVQDDRLVGSIDLESVKAVPQAEWDRQSVGTVAKSLASSPVLDPDLDALAALTALRAMPGGRALVVEGDRLVGMVSLQDLARLVALKGELEG
ncbi:MAG: site-2 protease family protein [Thermoanaerobaculia bacterium]